MKDVGIPKAKIMLTLFQIVGGLPEALDVTFPAGVQGLLSFFKATNALSPTGNFFACSAMRGQSWNHVNSLMLATLTPIAVSAALALTFAVHVFVEFSLVPHKQSPRGGHTGSASERWASYISSTGMRNAPMAEVSDEERAQESARSHAKRVDDVRVKAERMIIINRLFHAYVFLFLLLTFIVLPRVTVVIFQAFPCVDVGLPVRYLRADMSIECGSKEYILGRNFAIGMLFVYPIGVPLIYGYLVSPLS